MRRNDGRETWHRLLEWDKGQAPAERLAAVVLLSDGDGFRNVDPSHPLGGRDGLKDLILANNGTKWIGAVYFRKGQILRSTPNTAPLICGAYNTQPEGLLTTA